MPVTVTKNFYKNVKRWLRDAEREVARVRAEGLRKIAEANTPGRRILAREAVCSDYMMARYQQKLMREKLASIEPATELYVNLSPAAQKRMIDRLENR